MTEPFETALARVKSFQLGTLGEEAIKQGVILPLLRAVGWYTDDISQVIPEYQTGKGLVDYSLRIGDENKVFVEAKAGHVDLKFCEKQLEDYCTATKPTLAVLTNGGYWWLYVPKTRKGSPIGRFLEFDVNDELAELEMNLRAFLAHDNLSERLAADKTATSARRRLREGQKTAKVIEDLTVAWNQLSAKPEAMIALVTKFAGEHEIQPSDEQVRKFLDSNNPLVNKAGNVEGLPGKPASFTFQPGNEEPVAKVVKDFTGVRVGVCELMHERHHEEFRKFVDEKPEWFFETGGQHRRRVGNAGIYVPTGGARGEIMKVCFDILGKFGYPKESLTIQDKTGKDFQV